MPLINGRDIYLDFDEDYLNKLVKYILFIIFRESWQKQLKQLVENDMKNL
jgi:hypothetical protein